MEKGKNMQVNECRNEMVDLEPENGMTNHARRRMTARRLSERAVEAVLMFGRKVYARGAEIHVIGKREVAKYARTGVDLRAYDGLQVVCVPNDGAIMTVYRNKDFSGLYKRKPPRRCA